VPNCRNDPTDDVGFCECIEKMTLHNISGLWMCEEAVKVNKKKNNIVVFLTI
jgi:hypothetical protein